MYRLFPVLTLLLLLIAGCSEPSYQAVFTETEQNLFSIRADQEYRFGYLSVPENRSDPNSNTIQLPVFIFKSRNPNPKPDPIIYTVGGPGSSTMPSAQYMRYYQYLDDRDFILIEQRGTQYAKPHLDCPEWALAQHQAGQPHVDESEKKELLSKAATDCRQRLTEKHIDLNGYNTNEIAADIEDLRKALGFQHYNLLTISYSTKIAQVLLRDHPDGIRSVVMDSPLPLEVSYDEESVQNLMELVNTILSQCENDSACASTYPDIKEQFFGFLRKITSEPLEVSVDDPNTGVERSFLLRGKDVFTMLLSAPPSDVPFEIHKVLNNDLSSIQYVLSERFGEPESGSGMGMRLSVWCAEETPFASRDMIEQQKNRYPEIAGLSPAVFEPELCDLWDVTPVSEIEDEPIRSDIPVLIINGELDNNTPPKWGEKLYFNLSNSYHMIFKGWGHTPTTNWGDQCAMESANAFFNNPWDQPAPDCFDETSKISFRLE